MLNPEHIVAVIGSIGVLIAAIAYAIRVNSDVRLKNAQAALIEAEARGKAAVIAAEREKAETETDGEFTRKITDEVVKRGDENSHLQRQLRECEVSSKEKDGIINELRMMNTRLGERNEQQAELLKDSARRIKSLEDLTLFQETKIRTYELKFGLLPEDGSHAT